MLNKCSILLGLVMAVGITGNLIPKAMPFRPLVNITYSGNDVYIGQRKSGDWLLAQYPVYRAAVPKRIVTQILNINVAYNLTFVSAIDINPNRTLGVPPSLVSGGPGSKNASLLFSSKLGQPINFRVSAFGRR